MLADISVGHDANIENKSDVGRVNNLATFVVKTRWLRWNLTTLCMMLFLLQRSQETTLC